MPAFVQKDMTALAFKNKKKTQPTHSDLIGTAKINGEEYWMNVWKKKDKNGDTYLSVSFKLKQPRGSAPANSQPAAADDLNDLEF